jgi:hypothetical protein
MQVLTNFRVLIIFVGQGAKIFFVYNLVFLTHVMLFLQHLFFQFFFLSWSPWKRGIEISLYLAKASSVTADTQ